MKKYDVAAYIWPSYHYEPRMEHFWPEKDGEWFTVRRSTSRFPGHDMPRIPLMGYQDEADPAVMREHVELAKDHGVNVFIMDWYWFGNAPCFERQLNDGLIPALKGTDSKFYLMWANHHVNALWDMNEDDDSRDFLWSALVDRKTLESMFDRMIEKYFKLDSYYCIDGKPVLSIFLHSNLIAGLGGVEEAKDALEWMDKRCQEKGFPGLHIQTIARKGDGGSKLGNGLESSETYRLAQTLNFDSATTYQSSGEGGGQGDYVAWSNKAATYWDCFEKTYGTYFPHVSVGWDDTHRHPSLDVAVVNATPDAFEACLWKAKRFLDERPEQAPLLTINSWNEWTEGSYLLPDMRYGYRYLQAVRNVFGA